MKKKKQHAGQGWLRPPLDGVVEVPVMTFAGADVRLRLLRSGAPVRLFDDAMLPVTGALLAEILRLDREQVVRVVDVALQFAAPASITTRSAGLIAAIPEEIAGVLRYRSAKVMRPVDERAAVIVLLYEVEAVA